MQEHLDKWLCVLCVVSLGTAACTSDSVSGSKTADASVVVSKDASADVSVPEKDASHAAPGPDAVAEAGAPRGAPPEVVANAKDWPMADHDYQGTRATFDSTIKKSNVTTLTPAWSFTIPGGGTYGAASAVPVVLGNTVYYTDMGSNVFALNATTGAVVWEKKYSRSTAGPNGLAVGWGKIFASSSDHTLAALDINTGKELWQAPIPVPKNGGIDIAPMAYDGLVFTSTVPVNANSGYAGGAAGTLYAVDERTGRIVWSFDTDQSGNLWGNAAVNSGGGAWEPPTIDVGRGTMYWGIGNPGPYPGTNAFPAGSSRPGPDLYTSSVLALSTDEGKLEWYHQEKAHDLFDADFQGSPIIVDATIDGGTHHVVIGSGKTGTVAALDADTGKLLWRTPVGIHLNEDRTEVPDSGMWVYPGDLGGIETPPAYADGVVYVPFDNQGVLYFPGGSSQRSNTGGGLWAIDVTTGAVKWKVEYDGPDGGSGNFDLGGATVVNDLVVTSTVDGTVYAYDRATGAEAWRYTAPAGINAPPAIVGDSIYIAAGTGLGLPVLVALKLK